MLEAAVSLSPQRSTRAPRLGFAGTGWIGRNRLEAIAASGFGTVAAIADPADSARDLAASFPAAFVSSNFEDLLERDLDGIVIATPSALHAEQTVAALEAGKAVFCQKPLGRNGAETRAAVAAAERADRLLGVDLSYRHTLGMRAIRDLIASGALGTIYGVELVFHNAYGPDKPWFYDPKLAGGGCLLDLGIHLVDLALWCLDFSPVSRVAAHLTAQGAIRRADQVEDYAAAQLSLARGTSVQLACSWRAPAGCEARIEATFFGTNGGASFRNVNGSFYDFTADRLLPDRSRKSLASPPDAWGGRAAVAWAEQLAVSRAFDPEITSLVTVAETLDRIYESAS